MPDEFVTFKQFYEMILEINKQRSLETDSLRNLIIAKAAEAENGDLLRHTSLRGTIKELDHKLDNKVKEVMVHMERHQKEDDLVKDRVLIIEQSQKRILWLVTLIFPSAIAIWETISNKLGLGK